MAAKEDLEIFAGFAKWLGLKDDEVTKFIDEGMERRGHKKVSNWADNEEGEKKEGKSFFGSSAGGNWQYPNS